MFFGKSPNAVSALKQQTRHHFYSIESRVFQEGRLYKQRRHNFEDSFELPLYYKTVQKSFHFQGERDTRYIPAVMFRQMTMMYMMQFGKSFSPSMFLCWCNSQDKDNVYNALSFLYISNCYRVLDDVSIKFIQYLQVKVLFTFFR